MRLGLAQSEMWEILVCVMNWMSPLNIIVELFIKNIMGLNFRSQQDSFHTSHSFECEKKVLYLNFLPPFDDHSYTVTN